MIGRALIARLTHLGAPIRLVVRSAHSARYQIPALDRLRHVDIREHDFLRHDATKLQSIVKGCNTIVHLAGLVHQPDQSASLFDLLNIKATRDLAECARSNGVDKFVFASTVAVYGAPPLVNVAEDTRPNPDTDYGRSKITAEEYLAASPPCSHVIALRPSLVYGPGDRGNMLSLIRQILRKRYFHIGAADARKSLIYSDDLAHVITLTLEKSPPGFHIYNAANPDAPTVREIADTIAEAGIPGCKVPTIPEFIVRTGSYASLVLGGLSPLPPSRLDKLTRPSSVSVTKLQDVTGFTPEYSLLDGLRSEISWAISAGKIPGISSMPTKT